MKLDKAKLVQITAWLKGKWKPDFSCPPCGHKQWIIENAVFELRQISSATPAAASSRPVMPVVPIICRNCGYTQLLNPVVVGLKVEDAPGE